MRAKRQQPEQQRAPTAVPHTVRCGTAVPHTVASLLSKRHLRTLVHNMK
jgi:hypothetical protein